MRLASTLLAATLVVAGCSSSSGTGFSEPCAADSDCESAVCRSGACTMLCGTQGECPVGFDCGLSTAGDTKATCYASTADTSAGGFGTDCSTVAKGCSNAPTPCSEGFECQAEIECDPAAFCTKACTVDTECPPTMFCAAVRTSRTETKQFCAKRRHCSECIVDDQCPRDHVCATDTLGGHYCAKRCATDSNCRPSMGALFERCVTDPGGKGSVCLPLQGACHGPSALASVSESGALCSACRYGVPSDCAAGLGCYANGYTTERFCTKSCEITLTQNYQLANDTCPNGAYCYFGMPSQGPGTYQGICTGDSSYDNLTCYQ